MVFAFEYPNEICYREKDFIFCWIIQLTAKNE